MTFVRWTDLGRRPYAEVWDLQRRLVAEHKAGRGVDRLLLVEHEPVITLGRGAARAHILADPATLAALGVAVHAVERGGDVTYHGPGQLVAYPVLDLRRHRKDVRWYSEALCETLVRTLARCGIAAHARGGRETGVWVGDPPGKIGAIGVRIEQWVAYHGMALNVDPDLDHLGLIMPCGLAGVRSATMSGALGRAVGLGEVRPALVEAFAAVFGVDVLCGPLPEVAAASSTPRRLSQPPPPLPGSTAVATMAPATAVPATAAPPRAGRSA